MKKTLAYVESLKYQTFILCSHFEITTEILHHRSYVELDLATQV